MLIRLPVTVESAEGKQQDVSCVINTLHISCIRSLQKTYSIVVHMNGIPEPIVSIFDFAEFSSRWKRMKFQKFDRNELMVLNILEMPSNIKGSILVKANRVAYLLEGINPELCYVGFVGQMGRAIVAHPYKNTLRHWWGSLFDTPLDNFELIENIINVMNNPVIDPTIDPTIDPMSDPMNNPI